MKRSIATFTFLVLMSPITISELRANWPQIPATAFIQFYENVVVHSDFRPVPQKTLIRWSLTRDLWLQGLNWWTLDQSPMPVHIILTSTQKRAQIFQGFPAFVAPGAYFYDSNNNAFWFDEDISQSNSLVFLENGEVYTDGDGSYYLFELMLQKLFRWMVEPNEAWNTRKLWGHNPFLLLAANYAAAQMTAKLGPPPPNFSQNRHYASWEEVKKTFQIVGWPKEHIDRVSAPLPSLLVTDPGRYQWYLGLGIVDQETAVLQFSKVLIFFAGGEPRAQELKKTAIRENLQRLEQTCQKRKDC